MRNEKDIYRYQLVKNGKVVYSGITYDLSRRGAEHRRYFPNATIKQVGKKVTWKEGLKWKEKQSQTKMSNARNVDTI